MIDVRNYPRTASKGNELKFLRQHKYILQAKSKYEKVGISSLFACLNPVFSRCFPCLIETRLVQSLLPDLMGWESQIFKEARGAEWNMICFGFDSLPKPLWRRFCCLHVESILPTNFDIYQRYFVHALPRSLNVARS